MNRSSTATVVFSCLGHLYIHVCTAFYFVIVLALERDWQLPYHQLIEIWTLGSLMVGAAALPAGVLSDRFGAPAMMVVFFLGLGVCSIAAGLTDSTSSLMVALTGLGVFAAIYHPVGIPWLVRNAGANRGKALGFNGIFGALGAAVAGITAGFLIDVISWRAAFMVPGFVSLATGVALLAFIAKHRIPHRPTTAVTGEYHSRADLVRVFVVLLVTMFCAGLVYHTTQTALPKVFDERHGGLVGDGAFGVGLLVAGVYTAAAFMQAIGGYLADRLPLKTVYVGAILIQVPLLWLAASLGGVPLLVVAALMVMANAGALPAENMLLARYTPNARHGLAFGVKFVLSFGAAPLGVLLVSKITESSGGFYWVFALLAGVALGSVIMATWLPAAKTGPRVAVAPAAK
ncbi:MAG: MFS transporter [Gammaproteobacteria bacterium]|nr:MFS transporter [Gammaproteobacteria bacterium]